ncbi:MAG TPA: SIS domain-containing protein [Candidatus Limnocylindrales bacterium]
MGQAEFAQRAREVLDTFLGSQTEAVARAGELVAGALLDGGVLQAFATGHSRSVALELVGRAGGLVPANQLGIRDLVYYGDAPPVDILDPLVERDPGLAARIWELADIRPGDPFVIISQSGGNGSVVEMARIAVERGHAVVAITSLAHTERIVSRHASGLRLVDLAAVTIDNGAPYGDAALSTPQDRVCALSNLTGILAAQLLVADIVDRFLAAGRRPPVFSSNNIPGSDERNRELLAHYGTRVRLGDA